MPTRQSVCLPMLPQMPQDELFREVAAIGFEAVDSPVVQPKHF